MRKVFSIFATVIFVASLVLSSCKDENAYLAQQSQRMNAQGKNDKDPDNYLLKKDFAIALHKAMSESKPLREFIKTEALKMFDNDYDVLWNYVKDNEVAGTGKTLHNLLAPYFKDEKELIEIEQALPLLTILVPTLPEDCFSAEKWNIENDVPMVAARIRGASVVPIFSSKEGESFCITRYVIPAYPVIVVKDNERVILPDYSQYYQNSEYGCYIDEKGAPQYVPVEKPEYSSANGDFKFRFAYSNFDRNITGVIIAKNPSSDPNSSFYKKAGGKKVYNAWQLDRPESAQHNQLWQRDYIYYNLAETNARGEYVDEYVECLAEFKMKKTAGESGLHLFSTLADDEIGKDPIFNKDGKSYYWDMEDQDDDSKIEALWWTEGGFDFSVSLSAGNKAGANTTAVESPITQGFGASALDLFDFEYTWDYDNWWWKLWGKRHYKLKSAEPIWFYLGDLCKFNVAWRLENFAHDWRISIYEDDIQTETEENRTDTRTVNENFELSLSELSAKIFKLGAKFGVTGSQSTVLSHKVKYTTGSDIVADNVYVYFADDIIIGESAFNIFGFNIFHYNFQTYSGKKCEFTVRPFPKNSSIE